MKQSKWTILSNLPIADRTYRMVLAGDTQGILPGQFIDIAVPGYYLRRPISVCDCTESVLTIVYKVVGRGTDAMAQLEANTELDILSVLGQGYNLSLAEDHVLLIGGGVGVPPLIYAAKVLRAMGKEVRVVMGFNSRTEVFGENEMKQLGCTVEVYTLDGSYGQQGLVTDALAANEPFYYACGPLAMLRAIVAKIGTRGQVSMEERMGCGIGICVGCSIPTTQGVKRVCKEGPVFNANEIIWK